jgi:hypothetical protein
LRRDWDTCWGATEIFRQCAPFATASASRRGALAALPGLNGDDFMVFGTLIQLQHFCFIDLNLRRALELFKLSEMLPESAKKLYPNLPDAKLTETLVEIVNGMYAEAEDKPTALTWLEVISKTRGYRNLVGHFAGKRPAMTCMCLPAKATRMRARVRAVFGISGCISGD